MFTPAYVQEDQSEKRKETAEYSQRTDSEGIKI